MGLSLEELRVEALALPAENRHELAISLWDSLEPEKSVTGEFVPEQLAEFERRAIEVRSGTADLVSYEFVKQRISDLLQQS